MARVFPRDFLEGESIVSQDPSFEDMLSFVNQEAEARRRSTMSEEDIIAKFAAMFPLRGQENIASQSDEAALASEDSSIRATPGQSSFAVSGDETFENTRGSFSKIPTGTSDAASKRFADFLNGLSEQRGRELINNSGKKVQKLLNSNDPDSGTQIAQILQGTSEFRRSGSGDMESLLKGQKTMLERDKLQQEINQGGDKPLKQFIKESWDTGVINGEDRLFLERYISENPDATVKELSDLLIEANSEEEDGRDKFKNSKLAKLFSKRLNGE